MSGHSPPRPTLEAPNGWVRRAPQEKLAMTTATPSPTTPSAAGGVALPPCLPALDWKDDVPIRTELCSPSQFGELARVLAGGGAIGAAARGQPLLRRLQDNSRVLHAAHRDIAAAAARQEPLTPDAEWLLDNFHIIEEVLRQVRTDLPCGYYAELPALASGPLAGLPRVYALALVIVAHTDSSIDEGQVIDFVRAYQTVTPLTIGELWAVPIMHRFALLENLRRLASQMVEARRDRADAVAWASRGAGRPAPLPPQPSDAFLVSLLQELGDHPTGPYSERLQEWLVAHGADANEALRREHRRQAANQVSIGNCVTSLRLLAALDWNEFFEKASLVEAVLRGEPTGVYPRQDFSTRDRYRRAVEKLARGSGRSEIEVARLAVARSRNAGPEPRRSHLGYHLIGRDRHAFEAELGYRPRVFDRKQDFLTDHPRLAFFWLLLALTLTLLGAVLALAAPATWTTGLLLAAVALLPASELAVGLTNYLLCRLLTPRILPRLDFKEGVPDDCVTFVVIPGMLAWADGAAPLAERLELHFLANSDPNFLFALLTDFADAPEERRPEDESYLRSALDAIRDLNRRYASEDKPRFFLFHRKRLWNPSENCWMGWERKRGKLHEFNRLLRGASTSYATRSADVSSLPRTRYVLTLDADTVLPREAARRLVGILAHPLNQAVLSEDGRRVIEGYAILQPRVSFLYQAGMRSWFARIFAGSAGVDPYSSAVSDTYMDLFGKGTFTGKGLYEIDSFEATAGQAFPDNHILSHDLVESNFARCGLVTNVEVFDDFPGKYHAYARREHRWARGDWQLLPWLARRVSTPAGTRPNVLPLLERWKVLDNLRRSLVPPALVVLLCLAWTVLPGRAWAWTAAALLVGLLPLLLQLFDRGRDVLAGVSRRALLAQLPFGVWATAGQVALGIAFLLDQARLMLDAVVRTLWRVFVSRKHLLEWETAAAAEARLGTGLGQFLGSMWPTSTLASALGALVAWVAPGRLPVALPLLVLWFFSPLIAYAVSRPRRLAEEPLTAGEEAALRLVARKTWNFFETFVGEGDHWLPPDNYQEEPRGDVAHRTSPTNQGMLLLSTLAAHDLGYLSLPALLHRIGRTLDTLDRLERHQGHFFNWYDTTTLKPLPPGYVSTVDSGNLLACLLTLEHGLLEKLSAPLPDRNSVKGLADTLALAELELEALRTGNQARLRDWSEVRKQMGELSLLLVAPAEDLGEWASRLKQLEVAVGALAAGARKLEGASPEAKWSPGLAGWIDRLAGQVRMLLEEARELAPWVEGLPAVARGWPEAGGKLLAVRSLTEWEATLPELVAEERTPPTPDPGALRLALGRSRAHGWAEALRRLAAHAERLGADMDFRFLYNPERHLFSIGFNVLAGRLDQGHYDLLASEACLASFLAVARGDVPRRHWFHLGRLMTRTAGLPGLVSWGGTMFEYLMPRLLLPIPRGTLLDAADRAAVARQIEYGKQLHLPWGVSESAFADLGPTGDYQYQSFGVPGLGLKRGLAQDRVVAPYATMLAVPLAPREALVNLEWLRREGAEGPFGFYESIDYTPSRLPGGARSQVVRCWMAHHQGMALTALANRLTGDAMPRRFRQSPVVRSAELLLQERIPHDAPLVHPESDAAAAPSFAAAAYPVSRRLTSPDTPGPRTHLLSNGRYTVMLTNSGAGFSRRGAGEAPAREAIDVTRSRGDRTADDSGQFIYIRDRERGAVWSAGHQPTRRRADLYEVVYSLDKAEVHRVDEQIETWLELAVAPDKDVEVRRLTVRNRGDSPRDLELTSYAEVVLLPHAADLAHPAFGKLFLETEWLPGSQALLCRRRPRTADQHPVWAVHVAAADGPVGEVEYETDRMRFLGRRNTCANPEAVSRPLTKTVGPVLDPIFALRLRVRLGPGASSTVSFSTGVSDSREGALALADTYQNLHAVTRAFELAWAHSRVELRHHGMQVEQAHLFQRLAGHILFPGPALRAPAEALAANKLGQSALWRHGLSGDLPIVVVRLADGGVPLWREALTAHAYLRAHGLAFDLAALIEEMSGYHAELYQQAQTVVRTSDSRHLADQPGGIHVLKSSHMAEEDRVLLLSAARVVLAGDQGPLGAQIDVRERQPALPARVYRPAPPPPSPPARAEGPAGLEFFNGTGGFAAEGTEYSIPGASVPPAPWVNVVANPACGFLVSDAGAGCTWVGNSQANRLTPWSNDPVSDPPGESVYLRDEATGAVWSPTSLPAGGGAVTRVRHGAGYSVFEQTRDGLEQETTHFVPPEDPVKVILLRVRNAGPQARKLSATFYVEWVLGSTREQTALYIVTEEDPQSGAILARNPFNAEYASATAFAVVSSCGNCTKTADRAEFLGRNRPASAPAGLEQERLSGRTGAGLDPCAAIQAPLELSPGEEKTLVFLLGQAADPEAVRRLASRYRSPAGARRAFKESTDRWDRLLGAVQVRTPDEAMNLLLNRWLLYQTTACRLWGRSAFYQSGGAYGFRDQLQDVAALVYSAPELAREHLLRSAAHQFLEGDVLHWWHPPGLFHCGGREPGRGVRTRFSDDFLWLPLVACHYAKVTGDATVFDERAPFLQAPPLSPEQEEVYGKPRFASESGSLYDHCCRALDHGWKLGAHGLPLMGTGDWNDGMNKVGAGGKGESVWVAWFQACILRDFSLLAEARGDHDRAKGCRERAKHLLGAVEEHAWDGAWYLRAFFDDGTPLGSHANDECQLDSLAQSWAVLANGDKPDRINQAMKSAEERLVRRDGRLILLFDPPFDDGPLQPGYVKGYVPGTRENGGQYTHAAAWLVLAAAEQGRGGDAHELFDLLNPIKHALKAEGVARYRVEPYVVAGDVYSREPHVGRGGWSWYTGSAAWLYRVGLEALLGFRKEADRLRISPRIPPDWRGYSLSYRHGSSVYHIAVENPHGVEAGVSRVLLDGREAPHGEIHLADDGREHEVRVTLGTEGRSGAGER
jgi:cyclic beta-1,2-glucan synthetase